MAEIETDTLEMSSFSSEARVTFPHQNGMSWVNQNVPGTAQVFFKHPIEESLLGSDFLC